MAEGASVINNNSQKEMMSGKLWAAVAVILSVIIAVVSASVITGETKEKVSTLEDQNDVQEEDINLCQESNANQAVSIAQIETSLEYITKTLDDIHTDVKQLNNKG